MSNIKVLHKFAKVPEDFLRVDTTSRGGPFSDTSPFLIGPCILYGGYVAQNMENAWQFAKVYKQHLNDDGSIGLKYWEWAKKGWDDKKAHRYPMGKGAVPEFSLWDGKKLGYIDARKQIYAPLYAREVMKSHTFFMLNNVKSHTNIALLDYDGYDHEKLGMTLTEVLHEPKRKMGHAFVLKALLTNDPVLEYYNI